MPPLSAPLPHPALDRPAHPAGPVLSPDEQRRVRRMLSNRESARRSRMRKQRHLEGLRADVGRLRLENRCLATRVEAVAQRCLLVRGDNDRLLSESAALRWRLFEIRRFLLVRHLQRLSHFNPGNE